MFERLRFYIQHSLNDMRVNRQRTLFALLCIAAGVGAIVSLQTLAVMMNNALQGSLQESNGGDIRLMVGDDWGAYTTELEDGVPFVGDTVYNAAGIERMRSWLESRYPGSKLAYQQPIYGGLMGISVSIPARSTYQPFTYNYVIDADEYPLYGRVEDEDGHPLREMLREPTDIVISDNLASVLEAEVGDQLRISGVEEEFTVTGIVPTDSQVGMLNFLGHLFGYYYLDFRSIDLLGDVQPGLAHTVYIKLADPTGVDEAAEALERLVLDNGNIITTTDLKEANQLLSEVVDTLVVVMGLVSLLIGGIGIVNTMAVIVTRRTTEVAVLKTLGLEPDEVVALFLVEAVIMGILGSLMGILLGWVLAYGVKGVGENFLGQRLTFSIAPAPAFNGFIVGIVITTIFGFLPTLAARQIRPASVLRPNDNIIPRAGRLAIFVAVVGLILALSMVAQGLLGTMLHVDLEIPGSDESIKLQYITAGIGVVYGFVMVFPTILADWLDIRARRRGRSWLLRPLRWLVLLALFPGLGGAFGYAVPAILVLTVTVLLIGYLYIALWLVIWAVGGGRFGDIFPGVLVLLFPLFWLLIPVLIVLLIPTWILGRLIQRFGFVDFKIAMRAMLSTKGRGASTLVALVVGVFTLSMITMLVDTVTKAMEEMLENVTGGNIMVMAPGGEASMDQVRGVLAEHEDYVRSYAAIGNYNTSLESYYDASADEDLSSRECRPFSWVFDGIDAREIGSNLPDISFESGRNLDPNRDMEPNAEGYWPAVVLRNAGEYGLEYIGVGDRFTVYIYGDDGARERVQFEVVGIANEELAFSDSNVYVPLAAFGDAQPDSMFVIADVKEDHIREVRRALVEIPGTFVLETRFINDLVNRIVNQFTSFPILVASLALFVGGIVIANSVALSTLERRREIGIMKAVGLQRERVLGMLLLENGLMGIVGGLIGVGISFIGLVIVLSQIFDDQLGDVIPYQTAFLLMGLCILISLVAAILSVWGASGEKPMNVLRYE
ncbi:MAG: ABC transporter permease [Anaerolineae bacterium]|nr:ABC transporter permease [Anaerolineae bacterium]